MGLRKMKNCVEYLNALEKIDMRDKKSLTEIITKAAKSVKPFDFPIYSLHMELTSKCNALCRHCYNNSGWNDVDDVMTPEKWLNFTQYIVKQGGVFECLLSGGEPLLLGNRLFDMMDILHEDGSIFVFMTNGYLMTKKYVEKFRQYRFRWFQISIDGAKKTYHDHFRNLDGAWERAVEAAIEISQAGIPLKIAHCVTPYNIDYIDEMCELANKIGCDELLCGGVSVSGRAYINKDLILDENQKAFLKMKIDENKRKYGNKMKIKGSNTVKSGLDERGKRSHPFAVIRPNGDIRIDGMAPFVVGNILKDDFAEVWRNRVLQAWGSEEVRKFVNGFDKNDINYSYINYVDPDIKLS